jgi:hypothetical protein
MPLRDESVPFKGIMRAEAISIPDPQVEVLPIEGWVMLSYCSGVLLLRKDGRKAARISFVFILSIKDIASIVGMDLYFGICRG